MRDLKELAAGRAAASPYKMGWPAWKQVLKRVWSESSEDNIGLVAAGVAFYGFLAIIPLLGSVVLLYGLIADTDTVLHDIRALVTTLPAYVAKLIADQLVEVVTASTGKKGLGLLAAFGLALFGARNGAASLITALNIAYEEAETRGIVRQTLLALGITACGVLLALVAVLAIAALGHLESLLPSLPDALLVLGKLAAYALLGLGGAAGAATLYRYGPDRAKARWVWLTPGSLFAAFGWLLLSLGFGVYVANVDDYSATYGSLSAIVVLLTWLYLSSFILLLGAELNAELEHQTARDTTEGTETPLGTRQAWVADHVAGASAADEAPHPSPLSDEPVTADKIMGEEDAVETGASVVIIASDPAPRSIATEAATIRGAAAGSRLVGLGRVGVVPSIAAAGGLVLLRRRGQALKGGALLFVAGGLAFLGRRGPVG
ncbi:YihY/virulence factor BrkB family protein [Sphingomonas montanisoli]|uniref:YihY/virulence factor BrkB family protein n=2 Tax=Sphingomonas montanisoli TaxID=2606412 RepID=A0A5D9C5Y4_9SPHN|nr:YihY/virulence factor BrkB family protein [Sphingomonas montanisoli]